MKAKDETRLRRAPPRASRRLHPDEYKAWQNAKQRSKNRDLEFSEDFEDFTAFLNHVGKRPGPSYSLDRIDNHEGYVPGNLRWATKQVQSNNRSNTVLLTYTGDALPHFMGRTEPLTVWADLIDTSDATLRRRRADGWSENEIIEGKRPKRTRTLEELSSEELANYMPWSDETAEADETRFLKEAYEGESRFEFDRRVLIPEVQRDLTRQGRRGKADYVYYYDDELRHNCLLDSITNDANWVCYEDTDKKVYVRVVSEQKVLDRYKREQSKLEKRWLSALEKRLTGKNKAKRAKSILDRYKEDFS